MGISPVSVSFSVAKTKYLRLGGFKKKRGLFSSWFWYGFGASRPWHCHELGSAEDLIADGITVEATEMGGCGEKYVTSQARKPESGR